MGFRLYMLAGAIVAHCISNPILDTLFKYPCYLSIFLPFITKAIRWYYKIRNWCLDELDKYDRSSIESAVYVIMNDLETKSAPQCIICKQQNNGSIVFKGRICPKCQDKHKLSDHLPPVSVEVTGIQIPFASSFAYKYHSYLFADDEDRLTAEDFSKIEETVEFSTIIGNEQRNKKEGEDQYILPAIVFHLCLISTSNNFIKYLLHYFNDLFGPRMMPILSICRKFGAREAAIVTSIDKEQYRMLACDHLKDKKNIKYSNILSLIDEDVYRGPLKPWGSTPECIVLFKQLKLFGEVGGDSMCNDSRFKELKEWMVNIDGEVRTTKCAEDILGEGKKAKEQTTRDWLMATRKLFLHHNAQKSLNLPTHITKQKSNENMLQSLPPPFLTTSYDNPDSRRNKNPNPDNILAPSLTQQLLQNHRKELKEMKKQMKQLQEQEHKQAQNDIDYGYLEQMEAQFQLDRLERYDCEPDEDGREYACCFVIWMKDRDGWDIECSECDQPYHPSCLLTKYKKVIDKAELKKMKSLTLEGRKAEIKWICPPCSDKENV
eukprot:216422_1